MAELAGPGVDRHGAPKAVKRFSVVANNDGSASDMLIEVKGASELLAFLNAATGLPSMNLPVVRILDRPGPQKTSIYAASDPK